MKMDRETKSTSVQPATVDKQVEEDLWQCYGAQRGVWTENMLKALDKGVKGDVGFSHLRWPDRCFAGLGPVNLTQALALAVKSSLR